MNNTQEHIDDTAEISALNTQPANSNDLSGQSIDDLLGQFESIGQQAQILKGRIYELEQRKLLEKIAQASGEKADVAWGSQIRSYVLAPYQLVKDHRTGVESSQTQKVLDGDIEHFIRSQLLAKASRSPS